MKKDGGLSFETQLKIKFLPLNNVGKKCLEKSLPRETSSRGSYRSQQFNLMYTFFCPCLIELKGSKVLSKQIFCIL